MKTSGIMAALPAQDLGRAKAFYVEKVGLHGLLLNWFWLADARRVAERRLPARGPGAPGCLLAGQPGESLAGEVTGSQGLKQVVHGADERPFGAGFALTADR